MELSKSGVDRLGERLKIGRAKDDDLIALDQYRRSFTGTYSKIVTTLRDQLSLEPTGRPYKSTGSIVDKLNRESIRLSQMQDIAGCRVVVANSVAQEKVLAAIRDKFPLHILFDRRSIPSHGYRAIHCVIKEAGTHVEIQIRTELQHRWAELSEKLADKFDPDIKYGGGADSIREYLDTASELIAILEEQERSLEEQEQSLLAIQDQLDHLESVPNPSSDPAIVAQAARARAMLDDSRNNLVLNKKKLQNRLESLTDDLRVSSP